MFHFHYAFRGNLCRLLTFRGHMFCGTPLLFPSRVDVVVVISDDLPQAMNPLIH